MAQEIPKQGTYLHLIPQPDFDERKWIAALDVNRNSDDTIFLDEVDPELDDTINLSPEEQDRLRDLELIDIADQLDGSHTRREMGGTVIKAEQRFINGD